MLGGQLKDKSYFNPQRLSQILPMSYHQTDVICSREILFITTHLSSEIHGQILTA